MKGFGVRSIDGSTSRRRWRGQGFSSLDKRRLHRVDRGRWPEGPRGTVQQGAVFLQQGGCPLWAARARLDAALPYPKPGISLFSRSLSVPWMSILVVR